MMAKPMTAIQLHYPMIQFLIIQEHFQPKIGRNIRKIQPGPEKQHSYIKKECMNLREALCHVIIFIVGEKNYC